MKMAYNPISEITSKHFVDMKQGAEDRSSWQKIEGS